MIRICTRRGCANALATICSTASFFFFFVFDKAFSFSSFEWLKADDDDFTDMQSEFSQRSRVFRLLSGFAVTPLPVLSIRKMARAAVCLRQGLVSGREDEAAAQAARGPRERLRRPSTASQRSSSSLNRRAARV